MKIRITNLDETSPLVLDRQDGQRTVIEPLMLADLDLAPNERLLATAANGEVYKLPDGHFDAATLEMLTRKSGKLSAIAGIIGEIAGSHAVINFPSSFAMMDVPTTLPEGLNLLDGERMGDGKETGNDAA